jgi:hypothetical protein
MGEAVGGLSRARRGDRFWAVQGGVQSLRARRAAVKPPFPTNRRRRTGRSSMLQQYGGASPRAASGER